MSSSSKGVYFVLPADLPKPKRIGGFLRDFIIKNDLDRSNCLTDVEEEERKAQEKEAARKNKKKSVTLTVGAVEAIDAEIARLESLGVRYPPPRSRIIELAMTVYAERSSGASIRRT